MAEMQREQNDLRNTLRRRFRERKGLPFTPEYITPSFQNPDLHDYNPLPETTRTATDIDITEDETLNPEDVGLGEETPLIPKTDQNNSTGVGARGLLAGIAVGAGAIARGIRRIPPIGGQNPNLDMPPQIPGVTNDPNLPPLFPTQPTQPDDTPMTTETVLVRAVPIPVEGTVLNEARNDFPLFLSGIMLGALFVGIPVLL